MKKHYKKGKNSEAKIRPKSVENAKPRCQNKTKMVENTFFSIETRSSKRRKIIGKFMGDMLIRFPHISEKIFNSLDNQNLIICKQVSRSWNDFIDRKKFFWIRNVQKCVKKYNKEYNECPKKWNSYFQNCNVETVRKFANSIRSLISSAKKVELEYGQPVLHQGLTLLHFTASIYR